MVKALREKAVETASSLTESPFDLTGLEGTGLIEPKRGKTGLSVDFRPRLCLCCSHCDREVPHLCRAPQAAFFPT